jgi:hypothetical protein
VAKKSTMTTLPRRSTELIVPPAKETRSNSGASGSSDAAGGAAAPPSGSESPDGVCPHAASPTERERRHSSLFTGKPPFDATLTISNGASREWNAGYVVRDEKGISAPYDVIQADFDLRVVA